MIEQAQSQHISWTELRDKRGKLCARLDTKRMLLEIRRSDRDLVAVFDLREYLVQLRLHTRDESR